MFAISPKLGEFLIKATKAKDLNVAFYKIFSEYLVLKLIELNETISTFENKWGINFEMFQKKLKNNDLGENVYSYNIKFQIHNKLVLRPFFYFFYF